MTSAAGRPRGQWRIVPHGLHVIPAKAGIQLVSGESAKACWMDSRFRGNDVQAGAYLLFKWRRYSLSAAIDSGVTVC